MTGRNVRRVRRQSGRAQREPVATVHPRRSLREDENLPEAGGKEVGNTQK